MSTDFSAAIPSYSPSHATPPPPPHRPEDQCTTTISPSDFKAYEAELAKARVQKCDAEMAKLMGYFGGGGGGGGGGANTTPPPRIGLMVSGGGWRAMSSTVAVMDALSTRLQLNADGDDAAKNNNLNTVVVELNNADSRDEVHHYANDATINNGTVKLMDCISHIFGLSGGAWALLASIAGEDVHDQSTSPQDLAPTARRNPFHQPPSTASHVKAADPTTNTNRAPILMNPWLHGPSNHYDPQQHTYEGLINMLSKDSIDAALNRSGVQKLLASLIPIDLSATVAVLGSGTKAESWCHFLASHILSFLEDGDPTNGSERYMKELSSMRRLIERGEFPFVVISAAADRAADTSSPLAKENIETSKAQKRRFDWIEFSPFFMRNPTTLDFVGRERIDDCDVWFPDTASFYSDREEMRNGYLSPSEKVRRLQKMSAATTPEKLRLHHVIGISGLAIAYGVREIIDNFLGGEGKDTAVSNVLQDLNSFIKTKLLGSDMEETIWSGTLSAVSYGPSSASRDQQNAAGKKNGEEEAEANTNICRDAGLDFNVPFPAVFDYKNGGVNHTGRLFDIVISVDNTQGATGAANLERAIQYGYVRLKGEYDPETNTTSVTDGMRWETLDPETNTFAGTAANNKSSGAGQKNAVLLPHRSYDKGQRVRIYETDNGDKQTSTLIFHFLGATERPTADVALPAADVRADAHKTRTAVIESVVPALLATLKARYATGAARTNSSPPPSFVDCDVCVPAFIRPKNPSTFDGVSFAVGPQFTESPISQEILVKRAAEGRLNTPIDAFLAIDGALADIAIGKYGGGDSSNIAAEVLRLRSQLVELLEEEAVAMLCQSGDTDAFLGKLKAFAKLVVVATKNNGGNGPKTEIDFFNRLIAVGILQRKREPLSSSSSSSSSSSAALMMSANNSSSKALLFKPITSISEVSHVYLRYATEWVDYYAVTAYARFNLLSTAAGGGNDGITTATVEPLLRAIGRYDGFVVTDSKGRKTSGSAPKCTYRKPIEKMLVHDNLRSNFFLLMGSATNVLIAALAVPTANNSSTNALMTADAPSASLAINSLLKRASTYISTQYIHQIDVAFKGFGDIVKRNGKGSPAANVAADDCEQMLVKMCGNIRDCFAEILSTPSVHQQTALRGTVLGYFEGTARSIYDALEQRFQTINGKSSSCEYHLTMLQYFPHYRQIFRLAESIGTMVGPRVANDDSPCAANNPHALMLDVLLTGLPPAGDAGKQNKRNSKGSAHPSLLQQAVSVPVLSLARTSPVFPPVVASSVEEDLLRIVAALYTFVNNSNASGGLLYADAVANQLNAMWRGGGSNPQNSTNTVVITMNLDTAAKYAFSSALRYYLQVEIAKKQNRNQFAVAGADDEVVALRAAHHHHQRDATSRILKLLTAPSASTPASAASAPTAHKTLNRREHFHMALLTIFTVLTTQDEVCPSEVLEAFQQGLGSVVSDSSGTSTSPFDVSNDDMFLLSKCLSAVPALASSSPYYAPISSSTSSADRSLASVVTPPMVVVGLNLSSASPKAITALLTLLQYQRAWVRISVPSAAMAKLSREQRAMVEYINDKSAFGKNGGINAFTNPSGEKEGGCCRCCTIA